MKPVQLDGDKVAVSPEHMQEIAAAIVPQVVQAPWQPIETAPKTGRKVLLAYKNKLGKWRRIIASYYSQEYIDEYWENADECEPGWYERSEAHESRTETVEAIEGNPTHWMPLPASPDAAPIVATVPSGWKLVPIQLTMAMHRAFNGARHENPHSLDDQWAAMLKDAPAAPISTAAEQASDVLIAALTQIASGHDMHPCAMQGIASKTLEIYRASATPADKGNAPAEAKS